MGPRGPEVEHELSIVPSHKQARYREELVEGPTLALELPERRLLFNPNTVVPLGVEGSVYPGAILEGPWAGLR